MVHRDGLGVAQKLALFISFGILLGAVLCDSAVSHASETPVAPRPSAHIAPDGPTAAATPTALQHPDQGHEHIPNPRFPHIPYNSNPPSSGPHTSYITSWGTHDEPVANEILVHNLEHGGIVVGYHCETPCEEQVATLIRLTAAFPMVVIAPNPGLDHPVALSAWTHTLTLEHLQPDAERAVTAFLQAHHGIDHHVVPDAADGPVMEGMPAESWDSPKIP